MELKTAVCDDEPVICSEIKDKFMNYRPGYHVSLFRSGADLLRSCLEYDLILLDIEMPEPDGMRVAKQLRGSGFNGFIVFLTSHAELMQEAFKVSAFRYLTKPIDEADFLEMLTECEKALSNKKKIIVELPGATILLGTDDIICFETYGNFTCIHTRTDHIETRKPLKYWMSQVEPEQFYQTYKSCYVSLRYIKSIEHDMVNLYYMNRPLPLSRRKYAGLKQTFCDYISKYARYLHE